MNSGEGQVQTFREDIRDFLKTLVWILNYLRRRVIYLIITGILGVTGAGIFLFLSPKQYVATIQISQINPTLISGYENFLLTYDLKSFAERVKFPTSFSQNQIEACGLAGHDNPGIILSDRIKLRFVTDGLIEFIIAGDSIKKVEACAGSLVDLINSIQSREKTALLAGATAILAGEEENFEKSKNLLRNSGKLEMKTQDHLIVEIKMNNLANKINLLSTFISINSSAKNTFTAISVNPNPVYPKKNYALILGLFLSLFIAIMRDIILYSLSDAS